MKRKKSNKIKYIVFAVFILIFALFLASLKIDTITITGNQYYSPEQVKEILNLNDPSNTIYFLLKNKFRPIEEVPFLDKIDISLENLNSVHINVYEKKVIGCTRYMNLYLYFDRDGVIVETSANKREEILEVKGLKYGSAVMLQPLPIKNTKIFQSILELMQLISKFNLNMDQVYFDSMYNITLVSEEIRIICGQAEELHEKIAKLEKILPELQGKKGELDIRNASKNLLFRENIQSEDENTVENSISEDSESLP